MSQKINFKVSLKFPSRIYGILNKMTWDKIGILSANLGATKVEHFGTQNHNFDKIKSLL